MPPARNPTTHAHTHTHPKPHASSIACWADFESMQVCLLFPEPFNVSPNQAAKHGLANGSEWFPSPGLPCLHRTLPSPTSTPSRSPRSCRLMQAWSDRQGLLLPSATRQCAAILRSELLENKGTNRQDRGELRFLPGQRHPSRTPYPAVRDVATDQTTTSGPI